MARGVSRVCCAQKWHALNKSLAVRGVESLPRLHTEMKGIMKNISNYYLTGSPRSLVSWTDKLCYRLGSPGGYTGSGKLKRQERDHFAAIKQMQHRSSLAARAQQQNSNTNLESHYGRIDVIIGPMFAGKTSELLNRVNQAQDSGLRVMLVKSEKDSRYSTKHIVTHDGKKKDCFSVSDLADVKANYSKEYAECHVVAIDEAQFFKDLVAFCQMAADRDNKHVVIAGLDGDFLRKRFGQVVDMLPLADSVKKLSADCYFCAKHGAAGTSYPAIFSLRITGTQDQELVGGAEAYVAACRKHYVEHAHHDPERE